MDYSKQVANAVEHFWRTRLKQDKNQGSATGVRDAGSRSAVTGGAQLNGFIHLLAFILKDAGLPDHAIYTKKTVLPGYFRPTKDWDLVAIVDGQLLAEALGSATDIWIAYREGAFKPSQKPWLGWLMLLEDTPKSQSNVRVQEPHFEVFKEFKGSSYAKRYELFCERLVRERLYDATCFLLSDRSSGLDGVFSEPNAEVNFKNFATSLSAHAIAFAKMREKP